VALAASLGNADRTKAHWEDALEQAEAAERGGQALSLDEIIVGALVVKAEALTNLGKRTAADAALGVLEASFARLSVKNRKLDLLAPSVAHARCLYLCASGDDEALEGVAHRGWVAVRRQWVELAQSDFSRSFVENIAVHRRLMEWAGVNLDDEEHGTATTSP